MVNLLLSGNTLVAQFSDREAMQSENLSTFRVSLADKSVVNASGPTRSEQGRQGGGGASAAPSGRE